MSKQILRKWVELRYGTEGALRAEDIPYSVSQSIKDKVTAHESATSGVHGAGIGSVVTTSGSQTLANKTLTDPIVNDTISTPVGSNSDLKIEPDGIGKTIIEDLAFKNVDDDDYYIHVQRNGVITAHRILSFNVNNADATITIEGTGAVIDQDLTQDASPTFASIKIVDDYATGYKLEIDSLSDSVAQLTADRTLYIDVDDGDRLLTIEANSIIDQDLSQDAEDVQFGSIKDTEVKNLPVLTKTDDYVITSNDFGKSIRMQSAVNKQFDLLDGDSTIDGYRLTIIKSGTGHLTIQAAVEDDIGSSGAGTVSGGRVENNTTETYASIVLEWVDAVSTWVPISTYGTWSFVAV